jgi:hypothetical protein
MSTSRCWCVASHHTFERVFMSRCICFVSPFVRFVLSVAISSLFLSRNAHVVVFFRISLYSGIGHQHPSSSFRAAVRIIRFFSLSKRSRFSRPSRFPYYRPVASVTSTPVHRFAPPSRLQSARAAFSVYFEEHTLR